MKKMLKSKLQGVPEAEQEKLFALIEKNPDFFANVAKEVEVEMKKGKPQMEATMEVMKRHQDTLKGMMK